MSASTRTNQKPRCRLIAFYLPQFHPIPENDEWWGPGFTEWTNVAKAKPLFRGHYQPRVPADLGFYDLRVPEVRLAQAEMARNAGIEGFCYWHYWFAGKRLLERPFNEVLASGEPDFPFCLGWANQTWSGIWHGAPNRVLMRQTYPGPEDHERHFYAVLPAFQDRRYIRVQGKPVFLVYQPAELPEPGRFIEQWQRLAAKNGLAGIHFVAHVLWTAVKSGPQCDAFSAVTLVAALKGASLDLSAMLPKYLHKIITEPRGVPRVNYAVQGGLRLLSYTARKVLAKMGRKSLAVVHYKDAMLFFLDGLESQKQRCYPCLIPNWDNSPRSGRRGFVLHGSTPELFRTHVRETVKLVESRDSEERIVFVKSWNEWAEGNHLEPDLRFGHGYLDVLREEVMSVVPVAARTAGEASLNGIPHLKSNPGVEINSD